MTPNDTSNRSTTEYARWAPIVNVALGLWLAIVPTFLPGAEGLGFWSDLGVGLAIVGLAAVGIYGASNRKQSAGVGPGVNALLGLWVVVTPFLFCAGTVILLWNDVIENVADEGALAEIGDFVVGFVTEGLYRMTDGDLEWSDPTDQENAHLEVFVADRAHGRFVPQLDVQATLDPADCDESVGPVDVTLVWHPATYHYGTNLALADQGTYDVVVEFDAPTFPRHDRENRQRFTESTEVRFDGAEIPTGRS